MTSSNRPPDSESELIERLASLRVAPPDEAQFLEQFRARLEIEALPIEIPGARVLPLRRKVPKVVVVAAALALAGAAAAATLRLVREEPRPPTPAPTTPSAERDEKGPRLQRHTPRPEILEAPREPERPARLAPRRHDEVRSAPAIERAAEPTQLSPQARERAPVTLERLELRRQTETRSDAPGASARPLERVPGDRTGTPADLERTGPDRSLQKVGPGGMSREERMGQDAPVERRPGGAPAP